MKQYDVIIIGGGPAGLTAAIYALRSGCSVLLFEGSVLGGQSSTSYEIANYPGIEMTTGIDLAMKMHAQAEKLGLETEYQSVKSIDCENKTILAESGEFKALCIILAMGAKPKQLGVKNESSLAGRGVHYCATCDGGFYKDKNVLVVGGGDTAAEEVVYLANICNKVTMLVRSNQLKCQDILLDKIDKLVKQNKVKIMYNTAIFEILDKENTVNGVKVKFDSVEKIIQTDAVFVAIGREPDNKLIKGQIKLNKQGYIKSNEKMHTNIDGIFVAGDIREKDHRQIITACSDGSIAGIEANLYINHKRG